MSHPGAPIPITAAAWITPLGDDLERVWSRLLAGEAGFAVVPSPARLRSDLAAVVAAVPLATPASERMQALGLSALQRALAQSGCSAEDPDVQLVLGTSLGAFLEGEPGSAPLHAWADRLGAAVGASRPPIALSTACSSGADALLVGAELVRAGAARCCVCGGVDVLTLSKRLAHSALGTMSSTRLRAFDLRHDGMLLGEGAGFMVLEAGAKAPVGWLRGVGSANDAAGMTAPDAAGRGARYALERSLRDAGVKPSAIGVVNAHGSGTKLNDATEALALGEVFGDQAEPAPLVFATKGNFGHSLGATGILEAITVLLALLDGQAPPIAGLEQPDPAMTLPLAGAKPRPIHTRLGLSLTLGFGGFDTSVILEVA